MDATLTASYLNSSGLTSGMPPQPGDCGSGACASQSVVNNLLLEQIVGSGQTPQGLIKGDVAGCMTTRWRFESAVDSLEDRGDSTIPIEDSPTIRDHLIEAMAELFYMKINAPRVARVLSSPPKTALVGQCIAPAMHILRLGTAVSPITDRFLKTSLT